MLITFISGTLSYTSVPICVLQSRLLTSSHPVSSMLWYAEWEKSAVGRTAGEWGQRERMPSTYNRIRSPRFYQESMRAGRSPATSCVAYYLITGATCPDEAHWTREWTRRGAPAPATTCLPGIWKLRLECTWSPFWNLIALYSDEDRNKEAWVGS